MQRNSFFRIHTGTVVLGLPPTPARYLFNLYRKTGNRPVVFARRFPLWLTLFPFARCIRSRAHRFSDILVMELFDFANRNGDKRMTLIPTTNETHRFVKENQNTLEASFVVEWITTE